MKILTIVIKVSIVFWLLFISYTNIKSGREQQKQIASMKEDIQNLQELTKPLQTTETYNVKTGEVNKK